MARECSEREDKIISQPWLSLVLSRSGVCVCESMCVYKFKKYKYRVSCVRIGVHVCALRLYYIIIGSETDLPAGRLGRRSGARAICERNWFKIRCTDEKKINTVYMTVCVSMQRKYNQFANITITIIIIIFGQLFARARECVRVVCVQCARGRVCVYILSAPINSHR